MDRPVYSLLHCIAQEREVLEFCYLRVRELWQCLLLFFFFFQTDRQVQYNA